VEKVNICGLNFSNVTLDETVDLIDRRLSNKERNKSDFVIVANQDIINKKRFIPILTDENLNKAYLITPDGYSIIYAAKIVGARLKERVPGPDLMARVIELSAKKGYLNFFLGAREGVAEKMCDNFKKKYPSLKIAGIYSPPFCDRFSDNENNKIILMINNSNCDILWVSFGCPKQEMWIVENIDRLKVPLVIGIGAAFDFYAGTLKRAPKFIQSLRLEWFYRFLQEPKRLFKRYFIGGFQFLNLVLKDRKYKKRSNIK